MKLEAIVNHETSRIHTTCIVVSRAQAQPLHKAQAFKQLTDMLHFVAHCFVALFLTRYYQYKIELFFA